MIRLSQATGSRRVARPFGMAPSLVLLYDGAREVPVYPTSDIRALTLMQVGNRFWRSFVCCGPAAPLPKRQMDRR